MRFLISLSAVALVSSMSVQAQASPRCADELLSRPAAGCLALQQDLRLSRAQARRVDTIRRQTNIRLSALHSELRRVQDKLVRAQRRGSVKPLQLRRLRQKEAALMRQIERVRALGASRISAVLTARQRVRCSAVTISHVNRPRPVPARVQTTTVSVRRAAPRVTVTVGRAAPKKTIAQPRGAQVASRCSAGRRGIRQ